MDLLRHNQVDHLVLRGLEIGGQTSTGKASGSGRQARDRYLLGAIRAKTTPQRSKRKKATTHQTLAYTSPTLLMATRNLINMVAVVTTSGAVLLTLLAAKYF